jgi:F0F1-type ATP synthase membrane subunit b/b'
MNSSNETPAPPSWPFIAGYLALIGAAAYIAFTDPRPFSPQAIFGICACVALAAIVMLAWFIVRFERQKNVQLDERQRELEALARTVNASAEQLSIATRGLHEIAEMAQKNFRLAEHLPHKLQDKIAEFQAQLAGAEDAEKEEMERELLALRTSESERLESISQRIAKSSAEWTKLEAATQQHLTAANEAVAKLAFGTAGAIGKAQAAAEQALSQARVEASRAIGEATGHATRDIATAKASALADLDARVAAAATALLDRVTATINSRPIEMPIATKESVGATPPSPAASPVTSEPAPASTEPDVAAPTAETTTPPAVAQPPKRPRKVRRDDPVPAPSTADTATAGDAKPNDPTPPAPSTGDKSPAQPPSPPSHDEPPPVPARQIPEITPVAPATAEPFSGHIAVVSNGSASPIHPEPSHPTSASTAVAEPPRAIRKKAPKKPEADEPGLGLEIDDSVPGIGSGTSERVLSSDGATRLLVTAYIGIGNRLFIRGQGPGLSWEKGVPLQFVSIGKWRWETNDANGPVEFKLYKNDDLECAALGSRSLDPGHQQEVTAAF